MDKVVGRGGKGGAAVVVVVNAVVIFVILVRTSAKTCGKIHYFVVSRVYGLPSFGLIRECTKHQNEFVYLRIIKGEKVWLSCHGWVAAPALEEYSRVG